MPPHPVTSTMTPHAKSHQQPKSFTVFVHSSQGSDAPVCRALVQPTSLHDVYSGLNIKSSSSLILIRHPTFQQDFLLEELEQLYDGAVLVICPKAAAAGGSATGSLPSIYAKLEELQMEMQVGWFAEIQRLNSVVSELRILSLEQSQQLQALSSKVAALDVMVEGNRQSIRAVMERDAAVGPAATTPSAGRQWRVSSSAVNFTHASAAAQSKRDTHGKVAEINTPSNPIDSNVSIICKQTLLGHSRGVLCVAISLSGDLLFSGGVDRTIKVFSLKTEGKCLGTWQGHSAQVNHILIAHPNTLFSCSHDSSVRVWSWSTDSCSDVACVQTLVSSSKTRQPAIYCLSSYPEVSTTTTRPQYLFSGAEDGMVNVYALDSSNLYALVRSLVDFKGGVFCLKTITISDTIDGAYLVTGSRDHSIKLFSMKDIDSGKSDAPLRARFTCPIGHYDGVTSFCTSKSKNDGEIILYSSGRDRCIREWLVTNEGVTTKRSVLVTHRSAHRDSISSVTVLDRFLLSVSRDATLKIWDLDGIGDDDSMMCLETVATHSGPVSVVVAAPHANPPLIITASSDSSIKVWN